VEQLIGNTPLIEIKSLSDATGCTILAKVEFVNPGGSVKDRVALEIIREAEQCGKLDYGGTIVEGTAGSTGVSLAMLARAKGYKCAIFMPDDQAKEKSDILERLGATVTRVRPVSIVDPQQFCNLAESFAQKTPGAFYSDQFENVANFRAHYNSTGPEIWKQCQGELDAFVAAAGTGGTIAGVSRYLKDQNENVQVFLIDPPGSSLYNRVKHGVLFAFEEKEGMKARHQVDSITEGIGINRLTHNFVEADIDDAFRGTDQEAVEMAQFLLEREGLFIGSSSAMNCVGAVKAARRLGPGHRIVTILCDHGQRHVSRFHNPEYLARHGLTPKSHRKDLSFVL
jgi:cysteine synthase A